MADLQRKTANLVSMSEPQGDGYLANSVVGITGGGRENIISAQAFFVTEYIPVSKGTYYYYSDLYRATGNNAKFMFYNANKEFIGYTERQPVMEEQPVYELRSFIVPANTAYMRMNIDKTSTKNCLYTSQLPSYEPYGWLHSLRKLTTATEAVENPLYSDGTAITAYTIKGNTVQNGTPTPSAPIAVNGVGERTENLFNTFDIVGQVPSTGNGALVSYNGSTTSFIPINSGNVVVTKPEGILIYLMLYAANGDYIGYDIANAGTTINGSNISGYENAKLARLRIDRTSGLDDIRIMFNTGTTPKPFEPYGYKIPISSGGVTTNNNLGSTQTTRNIKKQILTGTELVAFNGNSTSNRIMVVTLPTNETGTNTPSNVICTHFETKNTIPETAYGGITMRSNGIDFVIGVGYDIINVDSGSTPLEVQNAFKAYLAAQYANGTPVTVWYVLATGETGIVNEPLMKIGDYADTLSNATAIPTTEGANSITVDTTVQPSEFTATWTGWHDASVKEWDGSDWQ